MLGNQLVKVQAMSQQNQQKTQLVNTSSNNNSGNNDTVVLTTSGPLKVQSNAQPGGSGVSTNRTGYILKVIFISYYLKRHVVKMI